MATRTKKAAPKDKAGEGVAPTTPAAPKTGKAKSPAKGKAASPSAPSTKPAKPAKTAKAAKAGAKGKKGKKGDRAAGDEGHGWPEALDTVRAKDKRPGFFERLRQRRAEKAAQRAEDNKRREAQRIEERERQRRLEVEQRVAREAQEAVERADREVREAAERAQREAAEKEERARQAADERKMKAATKRAEARAAKEEAARLEAEAAAAKAAEEARLAEERKAEEERAAAEKAAAQEEAKARRAAERQRKREELEAEERRKAEEQAAKDAEAEVEARRLAANKKFQDEEKARLAAAKELEPDLEFEEASKPVKDSDALVPAKGGATAADVQAELMAAELAKRRSKPVVVIGDIPEPPKIPKAPLRPGETFEPPQAPPAPPPADAEGRASDSQPTDTFGFSIPEAFLLLANGGGWDERAESNKEGFFGGALAGAMVLELLMRGQVIVQRDRIVLTGEPTDDEALAPIVAELRRIREKKGDLTSLQQMGRLAKANRVLLTPFKQRLADKGLVSYGSRKHLGLFHRSWVELTDDAAQERLQNRLRRAIAGGGTPEAASILLLGLLDASGLFGTVVPDEAADYNRKRLNGLLGGRDIMGYKVDPQLKALQEIATRSVLNNVRIMTVRG